MFTRQPRIAPKADGHWHRDQASAKVRNGVKSNFDPAKVYFEVPDKPEFKNLCLPLSAIIAKAFRYGKGELIHTIAKIDSNNSSTFENACDKLWKFYNKLSDEIPCIKPWQSMKLEDCAQPLASRLDCNIVVHQNNSGKDRITFMCNPVNKDDCINEKYPNIHLLQVIDKQTKIAHISVIKAIKTYWDAFDKACYYCNKTEGKNRWHKCACKKPE